jgi:LTXXQ motif family protein
MEITMLRTAIVGLTALMITAPTVAYSQNQTPAAGEETGQAGQSIDWKAITDARIEILKGALQLTPDQEKLWPAVESAIRTRAEARRERIENLQKMREERPDFFQILRNRADNMAARANGLKQLADAWEPLYKTLDDKQKARLRVMAMYAAHEARSAIHERRMQWEEQGDDEGGGDEE